MQEADKEKCAEFYQLIDPIMRRFTANQAASVFTYILVRLSLSQDNPKETLTEIKNVFEKNIIKLEELDARQ